MVKAQKFLIVMVLLSMFLFSPIAKPILAADSPALTLQQQIELLLNQIISLLKQILQIKMADVNRQSATQVQTATLTVNTSGVLAYVSINGGERFEYSSPIILNDGDKYLVTAENSGEGSNSTTKCGGIASAGGVYICNVAMK